MRVYIIYLIVLGGSLVALRYPFISILLWIWYSLFAPQQSAFGDIQDLNKIIAGVAIIGLSYSKEIRDFRPNAIFFTLVAFMLVIINSQIFSLSPPMSYGTYDQVLKSILLALLIIVYTNSRSRFMAIVWLLVGCYAVFAARGFASTIKYGGTALTLGAPNTISYDRNHFAVICATLIPMLIYLGETSKHFVAKAGTYLVAFCSAVSIIGGNSRGGFVTLCFCGFLLFIRAKKKFLFSILGIFFIAGTVAYAPSSWLDRMRSIQNAGSTDASYMGRKAAWQNNLELAQKFPFSGAGMRISYNYDIVRDYITGSSTRAAHSAYYEILGSTGFLGFAVFIFVLIFPATSSFLYYYINSQDEIYNWGRRFIYYVPVSLAVFAVGAISISIEIWEGYLIIIALCGCVKRAALLDHLRGKEGKFANSKWAKKKVEKKAEDIKIVGKTGLKI